MVDDYTPSIAAALRALAKFRLVSAHLPHLRFGECRDPRELRDVVLAIDACVEAVCDEPGSPLARSGNAGAAARVLLRDHFMSEAKARLN